MREVAKNVPRVSWQRDTRQCRDSTHLGYSRDAKETRVHDKRETYVSGLVDSTASIRSDLDIGEYAKRSARDLPRWYVSREGRLHRWKERRIGRINGAHGRARVWTQ